MTKVSIILVEKKNNTVRSAMVWAINIMITRLLITFYYIVTKMDACESCINGMFKMYTENVYG